MNKKKINVVTGCYNEVDNLRELYERIVRAFDSLPEYDFDLIIADNLSTDGSRELLRELAAADKRVKVILNANNFGHIRSPFHALLQADGDAAVVMCSDLQDPPEMIPEFVRAWEAGNLAVCAVKAKSKENPLIYFLRRCYYRLMAMVSDTAQIQHFHGFGMYDRKFLDALKLYRDPYPYFRGLIGEIGFQRIEIPFTQERRKHGRTKNNFFTLYDNAMIGFVNHTKMPLRLAVFSGFIIGILSLLIAVVYFIFKLLYWDTFSLGLAPLVIGLFFFSAIQLIFIGIVGEYLGAVWTQVRNRPLVIEEERINFD